MLSCCIAFLVCGNGMVAAADMSLVPSVSVRETWDGNVFFDDFEDLVQRVAPQFLLQSASPRLTTSTTASVDIFNYRDHTEYNRVNQLYKHRSSYTLDPRTELGLDASLLLDHTFETELEESGLVLERGRRERYFISPSLSRLLDEKTRLGMEYRFQATEYEQEEDTDSRLHGIGVSLSRRMDDQRTTLLGSVDLQRVDYDPMDGDGRQWTAQAMAGLAYDFAPDKDIIVKGGFSYTDSDFEFDSGDRTDESWGFVFDATANWYWELTKLSLSASRSLTASSFGENITRDRILLHVDHRLAERLFCFANISLFRSETEGVVDDEERRTLKFSPGLRFRLTEQADIRLGYSYTGTEDVEADDFENRNAVFGQLDIRFPYLFD